MRTQTLTASEYARLYGCSPQYVTRKLNQNIGLTGMVSWRKIEGRTGSWIIQVLKTWVESKNNAY
jgi:hypothetical protein